MSNFVVRITVLVHIQY